MLVPIDSCCFVAAEARLAVCMARQRRCRAVRSQHARASVFEHVDQHRAEARHLICIPSGAGDLGHDIDTVHYCDGEWICENSVKQNFQSIAVDIRPFKHYDGVALQSRCMLLQLRCSTRTEFSCVVEPKGHDILGSDAVLLLSGGWCIKILSSQVTLLELAGLLWVASGVKQANSVKNLSASSKMKEPRRS